jgi:GT2 family glycosyltransferase
VDHLQNSESDRTSSSPTPRVYIVILNWNGWRDTIECLESVLRLDYSEYKVIVCDNASSDGSLEHIRSWARGETPAESRNPVLASLVTPPVPKPQPLLEISPGATVQNNDARLVLIQTGANLGFAGGNNVGLRYALQQGDCDFVWLLNNDTVVHADALAQLVKRMQERPEAGICGSTLLYYHDPSKVQAWGGSVYNKWFARGGHIGKVANAAQVPDAMQVERTMAYVIGASMLVRRSFLEQIGLMDEQYFLYFEELDWMTRGKLSFSMAFCSESTVYHKEGSSIGTATPDRKRSTLSEYYSTRSRLLFTRRFAPYALPSVCAMILASSLHRALIADFDRASAIIRGALAAWRQSI